MSEKSDLIFIQYILESTNAVMNFSKNISKDELISNRFKRNAIVREIEIIGEAVKNISEDLKNKHKEVEWKEIVGTRDKMIHHYFGVDVNIILNIIKKDIPILERQMKKIMDELKQNNNQ